MPWTDGGRADIGNRKPLRNVKTVPMTPTKLLVCLYIIAKRLIITPKAMRTETVAMTAKIINKKEVGGIWERMTIAARRGTIKTEEKAAEERILPMKYPTLEWGLKKRYSRVPL